MTTRLLVIDPQVDFCDPGRGALYVQGAEQDMARLANMIGQIGTKIDSIHVTLDQHHRVHIAHPIFWRDAGGASPAPFTPISAAEVETRRWTPADPAEYDWAMAYVRALESEGRYTLFIWPYHCLIGSPGACVFPEILSALNSWEEGYRVVEFIPKGSNIRTEHYSAIRAEVADPRDPATRLNTALIETLRASDRVLIAGEAGSHCVANTVRDLAEGLGDDRLLKHFVLLTDAMSAVGGFEANQAAFLKEMTTRGMHTALTTDIKGWD